MLVDILTAVVIGYAFFYLLMTILIAIGELRIRPRDLPEDLPRISVVLCARNEEHNLLRCLSSLEALDYPEDRIEINMVDDESGDRTLDIFRAYAARDRRFHVFTTKDEPRKLVGKQRPLNLGIRESHGEIVLVVDADIAVHPGWVKAHVSAYREGVGVAGGTTRVEPGDGGFFDRLQASELISKVSVAMGSAGLGLPLTIMGNNISFLRRAYDEVGGYEAMPPRIVEDLALMNAITRGAGYRLGWAAGVEGVAASTPESRFSIFVEQRRRWLNEVSDMSWPGKLTLWVEVLMNTAFSLSLALAFVTPLPLLIVATTWLGGYGLVLGANPGATARDFLFIPFMLIFQLYYTSVIAWRRIAGHRKVVWKGREYS